MVLRKSIVVILVIFVSLHLSCKDTNENKTSTPNTTANTTVFGPVNYLENDGIRMILHSNFERYSASKYESVLDSISSGKTFEIERDRLKHLRNIDGNNYIFFDKNSNSTLTINTIPYKKVLRADAKTLLSDIVRDQYQITNETGAKFIKVTAKYNESATTQIFKAIFKVIPKKKKAKESFIHTYYISSKDKSLVINLKTTLDMDFDPYLEKMIF